MAEEDDSQKTEEPTSKKLQKAREQGQVAQSQEVKTWILLLGTGAVLFLMVPWIAGNVLRTVRPFIVRPEQIDFDFENLRQVISELALDILFVLAPVFLLMMILGVAANLMQFGLLFSAEKIKPQLQKISPKAGLKRLASVRSLVEFGKGLAKIVVVMVLSAALAIPMLTDLRLIPSIPLVGTLERLHMIAIWLTVATAGAMTAVALLDFLYQRYAFLKQMRMSKQEVKEENKQAEGDPQVKSKIRSLRMQRARQRMMAAVPQADVVITNPTHYAVALVYKMEEMSAPRLVAKGVDNVAFRIREVAEENDVPIVENPPLARALFATVELEEEVPPEHYKAVAEVIGYVMRLRGQMGGAAAGPR